MIPCIYSKPSLLFDNVVIGSGPAGLAFASEASRLGKSVALVEKSGSFGGVSLHTGTIPSKTFFQTAKELTHSPRKTIDFAYCRNRISTVIKEEQSRMTKDLNQLGIKKIEGCARFQSDNEVIVSDENGKDVARLSAKRFFIGTGSSPRTPSDVPFDGRLVCNSSQLLEIDTLPSSMVIVGAGVIGTEYASIFSSLGVRVTLIDRNDRPLNFIDKELSARLATILTSNNVRYIPNTETQSIRLQANSVQVQLPTNELINADVLLYAQGRVPNLKDLAIEKIGLEKTTRGHIRVNDLFQTSNPFIYAGGDVIGPPSLASTSWRQGHIAARYAWGMRTMPFPETFPCGIFTIPEIGYCGKTEEELIKEKIPYKVGMADYSDIARNKIAGTSSPGFFKLLFDPGSRKLLGAHILGEDACDMIHYAKVVMELGGTISYFYRTISNYPTRSGEGFRIAALNGIKELEKSPK